MLVFTWVYVYVKAKLTLVRFFSIFFFAPFPYENTQKNVTSVSSVTLHAQINTI